MTKTTICAFPVTQSEFYLLHEGKDKDGSINEKLCSIFLNKEQQEMSPARYVLITVTVSDLKSKNPAGLLKL